MKQKVKENIKKYINILILDSYYQRISFNARVVFYANALFGVLKIGLGIFILTPICIVGGACNLIMGVCRKIYLKGEQSEDKLKYFILITRTLLIASVIYIIYSITLFLIPKQPLKFNLIISIVIAIVSFCELFFAIREIIKPKNHKKILAVALKCVSLCSAFFTLVVTQAVLMGFKNSSGLEEVNRLTAISALSFGILSLIICLFIFYYASKTKKTA